jgi:hypothetical protein
VLIPGWLYTGAFYGLLGCAGLAVLYYAYWPKPPPDALPRAELAGNRWRARVRPWIPRLMLVGGLVGAWALYAFSFEVIRVRDGGAGPTADRMKHLGEPSYTLAPGEKRERLVGYETWVVNESSVEVRIERISYGNHLGFGPSEPTLIPPGTSIVSSSVEYIGPGNRPPNNIQVEGIEAKVGMTSRSWLTW